MSPAQPPPPPEASLIRLAREAMALSPERAAARMSIRFSGARWRQIEAGYRKDTDQTVKAKPGVLAHMACAVDLTPDRLASAGRADAAEVLAEIERVEQPADPPPVATDYGPLTELTDMERRLILGIMDEHSRSKREKALLLQGLVEDLRRQAAQEQRAEQDPPQDERPSRSA